MNTQQRIDMIYYYEDVLENALSERHIEYAKEMIYRLRNDLSLKYEEQKRPSASRPVYCKETDSVYSSLKEAAFDLELDRNLASLMVRGLRFNKYGLSYVNKSSAPAAKKIYCGVNNKTYNSIKQAVDDLGIHRNTIQAQLKGRITNKLKVKFI